MATTRVRRLVHAAPDAVFSALVDRDSVAAWRVPEGMTAFVHDWDPREGGSLRISLTYVEHSTAGKTTAHTDTYRGRFVELRPNEKVVEVLEFETADPAMQGEMTVTITLARVGGDTEVTAVHDQVPAGVSAADNELGWTQALNRLAALVEGLPAPGPDTGTAGDTGR